MWWLQNCLLSFLSPPGGEDHVVAQLQEPVNPSLLPQIPQPCHQDTVSLNLQTMLSGKARTLAHSNMIATIKDVEAMSCGFSFLLLGEPHVWPGLTYGHGTLQ